MRASSRREFLRFALTASLTALLPASAYADDEGIQLQRSDLVLRADKYFLLGGYHLKLTNAMEEALNKGVTLYFIQRFEADRPRDFWLAEDVSEVKRTLRLSHNALLRNYQINGGGQQRVFDTLPHALESLGALDDWQVMDRRSLQQKYLYRARIRMYLDTSQLPKPLQVNAFTSNRWNLDSDWREWSFKP